MIDAAGRQGQDGLGYELVDGYGFQGTVVRYTVVPSSASGYSCTGRYVDFDGLSTKMRGELRSAMDKWEAVAGVQLVEVPYSDTLAYGPNGHVDLAIAMANDEPGGTAALTAVGDALRDLLAETNRECGTNEQADGNDALIVFDTYDLDTGWYETAAELRLFHNVALHELGHALGIDHSDVEGAVLSGNYPTGSTRYTLTDQYYQDLTWDDVQAARAVYGSPRPDPWLANDYTYGPRVSYHEVQGTTPEQRALRVQRKRESRARQKQEREQS